MFRAGVVLRHEDIPFSQRQRGTLSSHAEKITRPKNNRGAPRLNCQNTIAPYKTQRWHSPRARTEGTIFRERTSKRYAVSPPHHKNLRTRRHSFNAPPLSIIPLPLLVHTFLPSPALSAHTHPALEGVAGRHGEGEVAAQSQVARGRVRRDGAPAVQRREEGKRERGAQLPRGVVHAVPGWGEQWRGGWQLQQASPTPSIVRVDKNEVKIRKKRADEKQVVSIAG